MKKINTFLSLSVLIIFLSACENKANQTLPTEPVSTTTEKTYSDDLDAEKTAADTSSTGVYQEEINELEESLHNALKSETTNTIQEDDDAMSFCDCVKKNKELSDIMMADETNDADFDQAMRELKTMKTGECKIMFPQQNNIEEQQAHQRKVNNCLK